MDERTEIFTNQIGSFLKDLMKTRGLTAQDISEKYGINKQQLYAVLRMGNPSRPNYSIETFVKVLSALNVHLELHDLADRSNFDMDDDNKNSAN